eukprot:5584111-Pleurochrysis_carterae.AAC.1
MPPTRGCASMACACVWRVRVRLARARAFGAWIERARTAACAGHVLGDGCVGAPVATCLLLAHAGSASRFLGGGRVAGAARRT